MPILHHSAILKLQNILLDHQAFLIEDPYDLFYFLNLDISLGSLLVEKQGVRLFVDGRYYAACNKIKDVKTYPSEQEGLKHYLTTCGLQKVFFDSSKTSFEKATSYLGFNAVTFSPYPQITKSLRLIKTEEEISKIRQSSKLLVSVYTEFLKLPKIGLTEKQISNQFKILSYQMGADGFSFEPIIATGPHGAFPHHRPTDRILEAHDVMLVDIGLTKDHYQSDMTRMVFFGHAPHQILEFHDQVLEASQKALSLCKPLQRCASLDQAARSVFEHYGTGHLFCHSLGHGLGLETHEAPRLKHDGIDKDILLQKGMVITIEPGLYKEGLGGVRHEDLLVITDDGFENFYPSYI